MKIQEKKLGDRSQWFVYLPVDFMETFDLDTGDDLNHVISIKNRTITLYVPDTIQNKGGTRRRAKPPSTSVPPSLKMDEVEPIRYAPLRVNR